MDVLNIDDSPTNAAAQLDVLNIDDSPTNACFRNITLNLDNNMRAEECIGSDAPTNQRKGSAAVTGSIEFLFNDDSASLVSAMQNQTAIDLEWAVDDGSGTYTFTAPQIKLAGDLPLSTGLDTDTIVTATFSGEYNAAETTSLKLVRS